MWQVSKEFALEQTMPSLSSATFLQVPKLVRSFAGGNTGDAETPMHMRLEDYNFYQENAPPHRVIRGYPAKGRWPSGENEEEDLLEADSSNKKVGRCDGDVGGSYWGLDPKPTWNILKIMGVVWSFPTPCTTGGSHFDCEAGAHQEDCLHWFEGVGCRGHQTLPWQHGTPRPLSAGFGAHQSWNSFASAGWFVGKSRELVLHLGMDFCEPMGGTFQKLKPKKTSWHSHCQLDISIFDNFLSFFSALQHWTWITWICCDLC